MNKVCNKDERKLNDEISKNVTNKPEVYPKLDPWIYLWIIHGQVMKVMLCTAVTQQRPKQEEAISVY